jgi:formate hydrogenlyase subunit 3/multisubunit Na+/H+ antiporter MnhD subunit
MRQRTSARFFNLLLASMLLVVTARNGVLFLVSWEIMSLSSFFLVMFEDEKPGVREAGWTYLVTTHLGTALLLAMFVLLGRNSGSLDFDALSAPEAIAGVVFLLGLIGFGTKAGLMPLHVWLPEAHPVAPSYVSAVMSGVMIKMGIYGLLRTLTWLGEPPAWWGWTLLVLGVVSGVLGVLYALAQHDLKRLLAYHSVENIGIIAMALGVGLLGVHYRIPAMAALGFTGGLLHVVNHALFKSLLFLGAGSVLHATGVGDLDRLGGLLKRMPITGTTFLIGAAAICGLPPLNGGGRGRPPPAGRPRGGVAVDGRAGGGRAGADRRTGRRLLHQGLRHRLPRGAAVRGGRAGP